MRLSSSIPSDPGSISMSYQACSLTLLTIDPRITDDNCAFWKLELRYLRLDSFVFQCNFLHHDNLFSIARTMYVRP